MMTFSLHCILKLTVITLISYNLVMVRVITAQSGQVVEVEVGRASLEVSSDEQKKRCNGTIRRLSPVSGEIVSNTTVVDGEQLYVPGSNCQYVISGGIFVDCFTRVE